MLCGWYRLPVAGRINNEEELTKTFGGGNSRMPHNDKYRSTSWLVQELQQNAWTMKYGHLRQLLEDAGGGGKHCIPFNENGLPSVRNSAQSSRCVSVYRISCLDSFASRSEQRNVHQHDVFLPCRCYFTNRL